MHSESKKRLLASHSIVIKIVIKYVVLSLSYEGVFEYVR